MRVRGEVLSVETHGDSLAITAQCSFPRSVIPWNHKVTFHVPPHHAKSYYVGRAVVLEIGVR